LAKGKVEIHFPVVFQQRLQNHTNESMQAYKRTIDDAQSFIAWFELCTSSLESSPQTSLHQHCGSSTNAFLL
jgi:hypothetical protein